MKRMLLHLLISIVLACIAASPALATKPGQDVNPNGFPSGEHYNLNIIGKKLSFTCPDQEYDENGNPAYGNVVFVPEDGVGIRILMQSGKGKKAEQITTLQATDPCAADFDGDEAVLQIPKNEGGYHVYARALAKPTEEPDMTVTPELVAVEDESGNELVYLGLVTDNGFSTPYATFTRKKGKSKALDVTGLFEWTGDVCYFTEPTGGFDYPDTKCCTFDNVNGVYDYCEDPDPDMGFCDVGLPITVFCNEYVDEWVFNIGDFVTYLWSADNNGLKLLQVRFYPVK
jgi:hypothetical protein